MRLFEFKDGKSDKFWRIDLNESTHTVTYGRAGTAGQSKVKVFASPDEAREDHDKLIAEKLKKGYRELAPSPEPNAGPQPKVPKAPKTGKGVLPDFPAIPKRTLDGLAAKIAKKPDWAKAFVIHELASSEPATQSPVPREQQEAKLWFALLRYELVPFWREPDLWEHLATLSPRPPADVALLLSKITTLPTSNRRERLPGWPDALDDLVLPAILEDPSAFAGWESWHECVRTGVMTALLRAGRLGREKLPASFVEELARGHLLMNTFQTPARSTHERGLIDEQLQVIDGQAKCLSIYDPDGTPGAAFDQFIEQFVSKSEFDKAVDAAATAPRLDAPFYESYRFDHIRRIAAIVRRLPPSSLTRFLLRLPTREIRVVEAQLAQRSDAPSAFFTIARELLEASEPSDAAREEYAGVVLVEGILRAAARGEALPADDDARFPLARFPVSAYHRNWTEALPDEVPGLTRLIAALKALGDDRAAALLQRRPAQWLFPLLHAFADNRELFDFAFTTAVAAKGLTSPGLISIVFGIGLLPLAEVDRLEEKAAAHAKERPLRAEMVRTGIAVILAREARAGRLWDERLDRFLDGPSLDPATQLGADCFRWIAPTVEGAIAALPPARRAAWFDRAVALEKDPARLLLLVPSDDDALVERALLGCLTLSKSETLDSGVERIVKAMAEERVFALAKRVFATAPFPKLLERIKGRFGTAKVEAQLSIAPLRPMTLDEMKELAASLPGPSQPVTVLESRSDVEVEGISRVGGPGFELGAAHPLGPDGERLTHVFTVAVADAPVLRSRFPQAEAVALYLEDPDANAATEPHNAATKLVALSKEQVAAGDAQPTPKDLSRRAIKATTFDVSSSVFADPDSADEDVDTADEDTRSPAEQRLAGALGSFAALAGGAPAWIQQPQGSNGFLLQFDERFADVNLGDNGVMYVFEDTAFWQCH